MIVLIPEFDVSIPATCDDLRGLVRQPQTTNTHSVVRFEPGEYSGGLPIPGGQLTISITRYHKTENQNTHHDDV